MREPQKGRKIRLRSLQLITSASATGNLTSLEKAQVGSVASEMETYRLVHLKSLDQMYSVSYREHYKRSPKCGGDFHIDIENEQRWGLGWKEP